MGHYDQAYEDRYAEQRAAEEQFIRARLPGRLKKIAEALRTLGLQGANDIDNAIRYLKVD
jgi:hypothetical protein